ncbi:MAG: Vacuolar protein sorting-associated protein 5 [Icmadophila ericetorum]|nr:Vacuolar protein sorting-associated protein 5 [Icmadophila ericetorum]
MSENLRPPDLSSRPNLIRSWSTNSVKSLDISSNIPRIYPKMEAEDSPWGDVPSRSGSVANLPSAAASETSDAISKPKPAPSSSASSAVPSSLAGRGPRTPRTPRRVEAQPTKLEAVGDDLGPLGPLGDNVSLQTEPPPAPPSKEQSLPTRSTRQVSSPSESRVSSSMMDSVDLSSDVDTTSGRARVPPPVQPPSGSENGRRQTQPSVSIEQAAKPTFDIAVGDPHKVGDLTSSHIVYQVRTKTTSKAYKQPEFAVTRRYRDFLWLYNSLHANNPGVVVPPPPEKQVVGRFDTNFVESRRSALERMLNKTAAHPILQHDADLKIFLESDAFNMDVKHREHKEPGLGESKGMLSAIGLGGSGGGKFIEHDDWFHDRKIYLDALETQLKALLKSIDTVVIQRKALAEAAGDFSASLHALSTVELSPSLSNPLEGLSDLQLRIRELYERQAQQDVLTLGITVDEYIRLIASVKMAFTQRQKAFHSWHSAEAELAKRKSTQEKMLRQGKTQQDRLNQLQADVGDGERKVHQARLLFDDMGRLMRSELERFEREKVEDFKSGVETFLEGAVEAQKELIELWETFLMQLDAEPEDEPFFKPNPVKTEPLIPKAQREREAVLQAQGQQAPSEGDNIDGQAQGISEEGSTITAEE